MFNILLDEYPEHWNGYALNTDFRIGIMITLASADPNLSERERASAIINLLFKDEIPPAGEIFECITWFLNGWQHDHHKKSDGASVMDFNIDQGRIYSAFISQYQIDLNREDMHFWRFMYLLTNLEECSFTRVVDIRAKKLNGKMPGEERKHYTNMKRVFAINVEKEKTEEERQAEEDVTNTFLKYIGKR